MENGGSDGIVLTRRRLMPFDFITIDIKKGDRL
jgi:hypothetical protein